MHFSTYSVVFPGQGSQSVGMLAELAQQYPLIRETFVEASDALGFDLWALVQNGPEIELNRTENTQPAMLTAGIAVWRVWRSEAEAPAVLAGHSLGEYTALTAAGALAFPDAVRIARERGRCMQQAVPAGAGAMAAILGLDDAAVIDLCRQIAGAEIVEAVNFNAPGQVVIAGHAGAVARVVDLAKGKGAKRAVALPVSVPSHCALMRPAAERLSELLASVPVTIPSIPVVHNADARRRLDAASIRDALVRQLYTAVRWVDCVRAMAAGGARAFVECGPGKVLANMNRRIVSEAQHFPIFDAASLRAAMAACA